MGRAHLALDRGEAADALALADQALQRMSSARWSDRATTLHVVVRAQLTLGDVHRAARDAGALAEVARAADSAYANGLSQHADGLLALHAGSPAAPVFGGAIAALETAGAPYEAARVRLDLARALYRPEQRKLACNEAEAAAVVFRALGAVHDVGVAEALFRAFVASPSPTARDRSSLTQRECEVLHLVADGLGDRDVADRLKISEHTVHRHLANILTKLDKPSRAAAVAHALRHGIL
jgi:ATP/maltotriose-dependent transcriptional regulator MalT